MDRDRENIDFSLDTQYFKRPSQRVSFMIVTNSLLFRNVVPGLSTTAKINSRPRIFDLIVKVFIMLLPPPRLPMPKELAPPWFGTSFKHSLHMLLKRLEHQ
jgi:hypothetical protein